MTERSIVTDCKSVARLGYIGSNPILGTEFAMGFEARTNLIYSRHRVRNGGSAENKLDLFSAQRSLCEENERSDILGAEFIMR